MIPQIKDEPTGCVASAYYRVHPEDRQKFIDAVIPHLAPTAAQPGCIYYVFGQDLTDPDTFHLSEGWRDQAAVDAHSADEIFLKALNTVLATVRILDRQVQMYEVASQTSGPSAANLAGGA